MSVGIAGDDAILTGFGVGIADVVMDRDAVAGDLVADRRATGEGNPDDDFRIESDILSGCSRREDFLVLLIGNGGNGIVGGATGGGWAPWYAELVIVAVGDMVHVGT